MSTTAWLHHLILIERLKKMNAVSWFEQILKVAQSLNKTSYASWELLQKQELSHKRRSLVKSYTWAMIDGDGCRETERERFKRIPAAQCHYDYIEDTLWSSLEYKIKFWLHLSYTLNISMLLAPWSVTTPDSICSQVVRYEPLLMECLEILALESKLS